MTDYDVKYEDLPESYRDIADLIGFENALKLVDYAGGTHLYVPKKDSCERAAKCRRIFDEYKASRSATVFADLAQKYNYSEFHIRRIVNEAKQAIMPKREQLELFVS